MVVNVAYLQGNKVASQIRLDTYQAKSDFLIREGHDDHLLEVFV